jgi:mono/diheme cytochrome c family protein
LSRRRTRALALAGLLLVMVGNTACWEQWSPTWFPQMKKQLAVQAFEDTGVPGHPQGFSPPEGTVPTNGLDAPATSVIDDSIKEASAIPDAVADGLVNPVAPDLRSLENGRKRYETFCAPCHGITGMADGPVAKVFLGVLPLVVSKARTDGHLYTTLEYGRRRMPAYGRLTMQERWDIVNYVRYMFPIKTDHKVAAAVPGGGRP